MIYNIQAMRAVAALLILLYHALPHLEVLDNSLPFLFVIERFGFMGVDIFFVISGFVIAQTTAHKNRGLPGAAHFARNRAARIYLGYWPWLVLLALVYLHFNAYGIKGSIEIKDLFLYSSAGGYFLPAAWTLTYELYFYCLFAFLFFVPQKYLPRLILLLFVIYLGISLYFLWAVQENKIFIASPFFMEFFSGCLLYYYQKTLLRKSLLPLAMIGMVLFLGIGAANKFNTNFPRIYTFGVFAFLLIWLVVYLEKENLYVFKGLWQQLGDASYTLYLAHGPLIVVFYLGGLRDWLATQPPLLAHVAFWIFVLWIIWLSLLFYENVEKPLYRLVRK